MSSADPGRLPVPASGPFLSSGASALASLILVAALFPYVLLTFFARPAADDFSYANSVAKYGFWQAQQYWYTQWSGRYFSTLVVTLFCRRSVLDAFYPAGPLVVMVLLFIGFFLFTRAALAGRSSRREALLVSSALFALFATQMPSTAEGFYWVTGALTYEIGNGLFLILLSILVSGRQGGTVRRTAGKTFAGCLLALAVAGTNETLLVVALLTLAGGTALQVRFRRPGRRVWVAVLVTFSCGAAVAILAPGNSVRAATIHHQPAFFLAGAHSVLSSARFVSKWLLSPALIAATIFLAGCFHPHRAALLARSKRYRKYLVGVPLFWLALVSVAFFPAYLSTGILPPARTMDTIYLVFLVGWFPVVLLVAEFFREARPIRIAWGNWGRGFAAAALLMSLFITGNYRRAVRDLGSSARLYTTQMDRRVEFYRHATGADVTVPTLYSLPRSISFDDVTYDPAHWRNLAVAEFYGLRSITRARSTDTRK
jgi:Family of unknown function (DUF6056)